MDVAGVRVVVLGLGVSGRAVARLLARRGARIVASDRAEPAGGAAEWHALEQIGIAVEIGGHSRTLLDGAELVVTSPGIDSAQPGPLADALRRGVPVVSEVEAASWYFAGQVIGITGTNGKSTTTALTAHLLRQAGVAARAGGNLGRPFAALVDEEHDLEVAVLELSSFQLERVEHFRAHTGVLLNLSPDHLDRYPDLEAYVAAKQRLWEGQQPGDWAIYNADDPRVVQGVAAAPGPRVALTLTGIDPQGAGLWTSGTPAVGSGSGPIRARLPGWNRSRPIFTPAQVPLPGTHNLANSMAAAAAAMRLGVTAEQVVTGLGSFRGLPHRLERVGSLDGVRFFNDSKATNIEAARAALTGFERGVVLIAGGRHKGSRYQALGEQLARCGKAAVLIGEARPHLRADLEGVVPLHEAESLQEAVELAWELARPDGVVLLSPACSSFDMFDNYEQRGTRFREAVKRLLDTRGEPDA